MLSSLLRPRKQRRRFTEHSPFSSYVDHASPTPEQRRATRHALADFTESGEDDESTEGEDMDDVDEDGEGEDDDDEEGDGDEDGLDESPLLPLFSAAHLGMSLLLIRKR